MTKQVQIDDLNFKAHPVGLGGEQALHHFPNGYTASVLRGGLFYTSDGTYEIAVMRAGKLDYSTPVTDDVLGHLSKAEANKALADISALPSAE